MEAVQEIAVAQQEADHFCPPQYPARLGMRPKTQPADGVEDALVSGAADVIAPVEHSRHRAHSHARQARDISNGDRIWNLFHRLGRLGFQPIIEIAKRPAVSGDCRVNLPQIPTGRTECRFILLEFSCIFLLTTQCSFSYLLEPVPERLGFADCFKAYSVGCPSLHIEKMAA
jgi:hypothetical protein